MRHLKTILLVLTSGLFAFAVNAQDTNAPRTKLDAFEAASGVVIVRGTADMGAVQTAAGSVSVKCKQSVETASGREQDGIAVTITMGAQVSDTTIIDYDELDGLLNGLNFLSSANWSVTALPGFDAVYTTRDGLQAAAYSSQKRPGTIGMSLKSNRVRWVRISLQPQEFALFRGMIQQSKSKLDALRAGK